LKEVPDRLLVHWAASRRQQGMLTLDDLVEIAQLPDAQLDGVEMAAGAKECFELVEWDLARSEGLRADLRYLAEFTPAQRQEAMSSAGLAFARMSLAQQQRYISFALHPEAPPLQSLEELRGAALRVEYTQPGWFQWGGLGHGDELLRWVVPMEPGRQGRRILRPAVRERTREAALQAVRRIDPQIREALLQHARRDDSRVEAGPRAIEEEQIFPTRLDLQFIYIPGASNERAIRVKTPDSDNFLL
jgi:hypothetical protein